MRPIKQILLGVVAVVGVFVATLYSSCSKDECKVRVCFTKGSECKAGICKCPEGVYGANCETEYRTRYAGEYTGKAPADTFTVYTDKLVFRVPEGDTTNYNGMQVLWIDTLASQIGPKLEIQLRNNTSSGSGFYVRDTDVNLYRYSGYGTINGNTASMRLTVTDTASGNANTFVFDAYLKQP